MLQSGMYDGGRADHNKKVINQQMVKLIIASLLLIIVAVSSIECMKRTQYHEQVSAARSRAPDSLLLIIQKGAG
jgi:hypothetical protein